MRLRTFAMVSALACAAFAGTPARAAVTYIAAGGGSQSSGTYATPVVFAPVGGPLTFLNGDVQSHNVVSDATGPSTQPWCGFFAPGACPLVWSPVTDAGFRTNPVRGLENAAAGATYAVHCVIHPQLRGTLVTL
jgi:hypothetical protein